MTIPQTIDDMGYVKQELTPQYKRIWIERKDLIKEHVSLVKTWIKNRVPLLKRHALTI